MADDPKPIRRVVTGNDALGRSCVLFDTAAPNVNSGTISRGTCMTDIWVYHSVPAIISGTHDDGNLPFHFEPPAAGGHLRIVQSNGKPADYDPTKDRAFKPIGSDAIASRRRLGSRRTNLVQLAGPQVRHRSTTASCLKASGPLLLDRGPSRDEDGRCGRATWVIGTGGPMSTVVALWRSL